MAKYQKKTLRRLPPITKDYAKMINELDSVIRKAQKLITDIQRLELDSQALWNQKQQRFEVNGEGLEEIEKQMISKATTNLF